jgi:3',5'-cyclic AMP phosphodiesterase CpdA
VKSAGLINRRRFLVDSAGAALALSAGRAMAAERKDSSFCFCVAADPHCADAPTAGLERMGTGADRFLSAVRAMEGLDAKERPDFILLAGDVHPASLKDRLGEIHIPIHATPGNHESDREKRKLLHALFPDDFHVDGKESDYYSFVHKGARFIGICDVGVGGDHIGHLCSEVTEPAGQCEWIEKEFAAPEPMKVAFAHIPISPDGTDRDMYLNRNDSRWLREVVERARPAALFFGHLHHATEELQIGSTRAFNIRSCAWNFNKVPIGFLHVRVTSDALEVREIITGEYA